LQERGALRWTPAQVLAIEAQEVEREQHRLVCATLLDELEPRYSLASRTHTSPSITASPTTSARERAPARKPLGQVEPFRVHIARRPLESAEIAR